MKPFALPLVALTALALFAGCSRSAARNPLPGASAVRPLVLDGIAMDVPAAWTRRPPSSDMRAAEFAVAPDTELVIYYFGPEGAGSVEDNLQRWFDQFRQQDGRPTGDAAQVEGLQVSGLYVTKVDLSGRFVAPVRPGATETYDKPGYRLLGAIVESPVGPYYFKLLGPAEAVAEHKEAFDAAIQSLRPRDPGPAASPRHGGGSSG